MLSYRPSNLPTYPLDKWYSEPFSTAFLQTLKITALVTNIFGLKDEWIYSFFSRVYFRSRELFFDFFCFPPLTWEYTYRTHRSNFLGGNRTRFKWNPGMITTYWLPDSVLIMVKMSMATESSGPLAWNSWSLGRCFVWAPFSAHQPHFQCPMYVFWNMPAKEVISPCVVHTWFLGVVAEDWWWEI